MPITPPDDLDTDKLQDEIKAIYSKVATNPNDDFHFHRGPSFAENFLGYDPRELMNLPVENTASFAGVGNPHLIAPIVAGETVVDIGSGAGTDLFIAARKVGPTGEATGVDMTDEMIEHARRGIEKLGLDHVEIRKGDAENLPVASDSVDVVITNGVLNLTSNKLKAFSEIARVLKPGARLQYSDIIMEGVLSESAQKNIDLWTG
jgi:SAM-dependent methyltransferase